MSTQCPKCNTKNADTARFCSDCGTQLISQKDIPAQTRTIETPVQELIRGTLFAGRYEIIEELGTGGMGKVYRVEDKGSYYITMEYVPGEDLKSFLRRSKKLIHHFVLIFQGILNKLL